MRYLPVLLLLALLTPPALAQAPRERVWSARASSWISLSELMDDLARADVVFVGENHEQPEAHRLELLLLQGLHQQRPTLAAGFEMLERDVQPVVDAYVSGAIDLEQLKAGTRPWKRYESDYHPLVEYARTHSLPVVATNVPRTLAQQVAKGGLAALASTPLHVQRLYARRVSAPIDAYYERFTASPHAAPDAMLRYYEAQCLKDDTMAESVADFLEARAPELFVHFNGAFHSDFGLGAAQRLRERRPGAKVLTVTLMPVKDVQAADAAEHKGRAEYLIFHQEAPAEP